jgi:hypothetical protein
LIELIDKTLLFDGGSIGGLFLLVKVYSCNENLYLAMRLEEEGGVAALCLLTNTGRHKYSRS